MGGSSGTFSPPPPDSGSGVPADFPTDRLFPGSGTEPVYDPPGPPEGEPQVFHDWGRYLYEGWIGEGGMGTVYRARDPRLNRTVALKFLRGTDPAQLRRFEIEARAQAGIDHEHVCKIYDVGVVRDRPYIAMQYIPGVSLEKAWPGMTLEQKLDVIHDAALAVHEAHRKGIIHRDIKPGNILLEPAGDGRWHAYIMDFGLARQMESQGVSMTGEILGTPHYMAPEQANGEVHRLDRRTDVHSLGATLYYILAGRPPYDAETSVAVIVNILSGEPTPLHKVAPQVPPDVETIVMKCLEKEQGRRYDSALALAEDIRRFRNGDPVLARRASLGYRLRKRVMKNRLLTAVTLTALAGLLFLAVLWFGARADAARQVELAQRFGAEVKEIESIARFSAMSPPHDIRPEKALIRRRMDEIRAEMAGAGELGEGPAHYALGRGHLALREFEPALDHLNRAWAAGWRTAETEYALGLTLAFIYRKKLEEANQIANPQMRDARRRQVESDFRDPALAHLRTARGTADTGGAGAAKYAEGLIAWTEGKLPEALETAKRAAVYPWDYESVRLQAVVLTALADRYAEAGRYPEAIDRHLQAIAALDKALDAARSDPELFGNKAEVLVKLAKARAARGIKPDREVPDALAGVRQALSLDPENIQALNLSAWIHLFQAEVDMNRGVDPLPSLDAALRSARAALNLSPREERALSSCGASLRLRGYWQLKHGLDPRPALQEASRILEQLAVLYPRKLENWSQAALASTMRAYYEQETGGDCLSWIDRAIRLLIDGLRINPPVADVYLNLGVAWNNRAFMEQGRGLDPGPSRKNGIESFRKAIRINPNNPLYHANLGGALADTARSEADRGGDPSPWFRETVETLQKAAALKPDHDTTFFNLGLAYVEWAAWETQIGKDAAATLKKSVENYERALRLNPGEPYTLGNLGNAWTSTGYNALQTGRPPEHAFSEAEACFLQALKVNPNDAVVFANFGWLRVIQAEAELSNGRDPADRVVDALRCLDRALALRPNYAFALANRTTANRIAALFRLSRGLSPDPFLAAAVEDAGRARAVNPRDPWTLGDCADTLVLRLRAEVFRGGDTSQALREAEVVVAAARAVNPSRSDLLTLDAECRLWRAVTTADPAGRRSALEAGVRLAEQATRVNGRNARAGAVLSALLRRQATDTPAPGREALESRADRLLAEAARRVPVYRNLYGSGQPPAPEAGTARRPRLTPAPAKPTGN
ncbi:MAG: protein kinase [Acidobacteria bacterium]|nr:protein kinase [Acidobacteriota bacterium]